MTTKPEAFDIKAAERTVKLLTVQLNDATDFEEAFKCAEAFAGGLRFALAALERERAEHAQAIEAACRAQRVACADVCMDRSFELRQQNAIHNRVRVEELENCAIAIRQAPLVTAQRDGEKN